jgi:hypothetical protein
VASGGTGRVLQAAPPAAHDKVAHAAHHAFVTGFNTIAVVSVAVAAAGCVAGYALVRSRDFVTGGRPTQAPPEPTPAHHDLDVADRVAPPIPDTLRLQDAPAVHPRASANAGLDPSDAPHLLVAQNHGPARAGRLLAV